MRETHYDFTNQETQLAFWQQMAEFWAGGGLNPLDRQQVQEYITESPLAKITTGTILDLASGTHPHRINTNPEVTIVHTDLASEMLRRQKNIEPKTQANALHLPFANQIFAGTVNLFMMRYLPLQQQAMAIEEMIRVTKPGGHIMIIDFDTIKNMGKVADFSATTHENRLADQPGIVTSSQSLIPASFEPNQGHKPVFLEILKIGVK